MATLLHQQITEIIRQMEKKVTEVGWDRNQIKSALQAIEDYTEGTAKAGFNSAIETAQPGVFGTAQKALLVAYYILQKAFREGA